MEVKTPDQTLPQTAAIYRRHRARDHVFGVLTSEALRKQAIEAAFR